MGVELKRKLGFYIMTWESPGPLSRGSLSSRNPRKDRLTQMRLTSPFLKNLIWQTNRGAIQVQDFICTAPQTQAAGTAPFGSAKLQKGNRRMISL